MTRRIALAAALALAAAGCNLGGTPGLGGLGTQPGGGSAALAGNAGGALAGNSGGALAGNSGGALAGNSGGALAGNSGGALVLPSGAAFTGVVTGPSSLIGNTGAALIGNTGAALIGNTGAALVGNAGGAYHLSGLAQLAIGSALVYLTAPDERLYAIGGRPVTTTTAADGRYDFGGPVVPDGQNVVVNALLTQNRRLVGFTLSLPGPNRVDVDLATTYVMEFLRSEASRRGRTFDFYRDRFELLPGLAVRTREMLDDGRLAFDPEHLVVGQSSRLVDAYAAAMARSGPELLVAWKAVLGDKPPAVLNLAGNGTFGFLGRSPRAAREAPLYSPVGLAAGTGGLYIAQPFFHQIAFIDSAGSLSSLTAPAETDPVAAPAPPVPQSGTLASTARIPGAVGLALDPEGNLFVAMLSEPNAPRHAILMICQDPSPKFGLTDLERGKVYRVAGTLDSRADDQGFNSPVALAADNAGNLFVADQQNDRIVRIDRKTGTMARVAGTDPRDSTYRPPQDGDAEARASALFRPSSLAWRATVSDEELFVLDTYHQRIRSVRAPGGDWQRATMRTLAGSGKPVQVLPAFLVPGGFAGDGLSFEQARFHFARVDLADWMMSELTQAGLALDRERNRLYLADVRNGRIRSLDLSANRVDTVAGGRSNLAEGLGTNARFDQPTGLALLPDGDLAVADSYRNVVKRIAVRD